MVIEAVVLSVFGDDGPVPEVTLINEQDGIRVYNKDNLKDVHSNNSDLDFASLLQISMKSISLLMSEHAYQDGQSIDELKYFGILPFADIKLEGLTYFFLIPDEDARGSARASTVTILVKEESKNLFYDNMNDFRAKIIKHSARIKHISDEEQFTEIMVDLLKDLNDFIKHISYPISSSRNAKIVFAGLDNSGKTSMILGLEKKYSKLINVQPSKGVTRTYTTILGMTITAWDLAGQIAYREQYLRDSELYLYDSDLLFYLVDVKDKERYKESLEYFDKILESLEKFEEYPPIIFCIHKVDPDAPDDIESRVEEIMGMVRKRIEGTHFKVKFFETTIFEPYTLITAFSYGLAVLSPNREIFLLQLENLAKLTGAKSVMLLNEKGLVVSDYSVDDTAGRVFELSAPYFAAIFQNFKQIMKSNESSALYLIGENIVSFKVLAYAQFKLFVILFLKEKASLTELDGYLPEFKENVQTLLEKYY